jgi:2-methylcitrate dehydratase
MQKIKVSEDPVLTARGGGAVPTRVTAIRVDGQRISREVDHAPGFAELPMSRGDVERKFANNVSRRWPDAQTAAILQALWSLERAGNVSTLLGRLALNA